MKFMAGIVCLFLFTIGTVPAFAHHGNAAYDQTKPVTLNGTVTEFDFVNPHVQIYFDVNQQNGKTVHWACETLSPGKLSRAGWTRGAIKPGDQITITLFEAKTGDPVGLLQHLKFDKTGKELGLQEQQ
jgi:Family of unknown function (DUF6152)